MNSNKDACRYVIQTKYTIRNTHLKKSYVFIIFVFDASRLVI